MQQIIGSEEEVLAAEAYSGIVLDMGTKVLQGTVFPKVDTPGDFKVAAACSNGPVVGSCVVVIVDEEECVSPLVSVITLKRGGKMIPAEVVEGLEIGLCEGSLSQ